MESNFIDTLLILIFEEVEVDYNKTGFPGGVWPTMITPFTTAGKADYDALEKMVEWYIDNGVNGIFAICLSSEMFQLSLDEKISIARFIKKCTAGRVPVIASGHTSDAVSEQVYELNLMAQTGVDAVVMITNRIAKNEKDTVWIEYMEKLISKIPNIPLGIYECPYPFKRLVSPGMLRWCIDTGRFYFFKDTCCDIEMIRERIAIAGKSLLKIYNANSTTLLDSLYGGAAGYSGVSANFHPDLYAWLVSNYRMQPDLAKEMSIFLSVMSVVQYHKYPVNAKYHMTLEGISMNIRTRFSEQDNLTISEKTEVENMRSLVEKYKTDMKAKFGT